MSAAETIAKAIEKLQTLRTEAAYVAPWRRDKSWVIDGDGDYITDNVGRDTADLIVTLHRTIDAQLAILRDGLGAVEFWGDSDLAASKWYPGTIALAEAILGGAE